MEFLMIGKPHDTCTVKHGRIFFMNHIEMGLREQRFSKKFNYIIQRVFRHLIKRGFG